MPQVFDGVTTTGLSVDGIDVTAHKTRHELGGADVVSLVGLSGLLADPQKVSVQDDGTAVNSRTILNFTGAGVAASDDGANSRINITVPGGGGVGFLTVQENGSTVEAAAIVLNCQNGIVATSGGTNTANLNADYGTSTQPLGTAAAGTSVTLSRADHVHAHGDQAGGTLHSVVTTSVNGFMSAADKTKLDTIQPAVLTAGHFLDRTTLYSTNSVTYVAFLTTTFTTAASTAALQITFGSGQQNSNSSATNYYAIYVDTVFHRSIGTRVSAANQPQAAVLMHQVTVSPSTSVTVEIRARCSNGTLSINPFDGITGVDGQYASLQVFEIST